MVFERDFAYVNGRNRPLHIYLPDDYNSSSERYPVMYFFDGQNLFYNERATYGKCWGLKEFLDQWDKKMIIVGMECGHEGDERISEYLPHIGHGDWFEDKAPRGDETMQWIIRDIKPLVDREFRTWAHREATGIGGSSMGGIMSLYAVARYNEVFSKAACVSSAIGACEEDTMQDIISGKINPDTRVFLSWGTKEARASSRRMDRSSYAYRRNRCAADLLELKGASVQLHCQLGGGHCEADWEKQIPLFMDWLWMR